MLGVKAAADAGDCRLVHVFDGTPAQQAGLSGGDVLVALGGLRVTAANLDTLLARYAPGDTAEAVVFRRDELMRFEVELARHAPVKVELKVDAKAARAASRLRASWLARASA